MICRNTCTREISYVSEPGVRTGFEKLQIVTYDEGGLIAARNKPGTFSIKGDSVWTLEYHLKRPKKGDV
jgi:hypothetical protein